MASGMGIGVMCRIDQQAFWQTVAGLEVLTFPMKAKAKSIAAEIRGSCQAALLWEAGPVAEAAHRASVPRRLGPPDRTLKKYLTQPLACAELALDHRVRHYLSAVEEMGIQTANAEFFAPAGLGAEPAPGSVLVCPDSDYGPSHEWLLDRWLEISNNLTDEGCRVTVAGLGGGRGFGQSLARHLGERARFWDASVLSDSLPELAAHALVIAADGSLPHLAAHTGATCVTLFGPNDPVWKRPLGRRHSIVRHPVECAPCLLAKCAMDGRCQHALEVARVWQAVKANLQSSIFNIQYQAGSPFPKQARAEDHEQTPENTGERLIAEAPHQVASKPSGDRRGKTHCGDDLPIDEVVRAGIVESGGQRRDNDDRHGGGHSLFVLQP